MDTNPEKREKVRPIRRSGGIRIRLSPSTRDRLDRLSELYGVPPSTLGSMALGEWIARNENALGMADKIANSLGESMPEQLRLVMTALAEAGEKSRHD